MKHCVVLETPSILDRGRLLIDKHRVDRVKPPAYGGIVWTVEQWTGPCIWINSSHIFRSQFVAVLGFLRLLDRFVQDGNRERLRTLALCGGCQQAEPFICN